MFKQRSASSLHRVCTIALSVLWAGMSTAAGPAETYPNHPIRVIVTYPAGSGSDQVARPVVQKLAEVLGASVIVENRPGGGTVIGMNVVAKAPPDGYTLLLATTSLAITPGLYPLPFDPAKDLAPVFMIGSVPLLLLASAQSNIGSVGELIAMARARPGQLNFASSGVGGALHLGMELLNAMTGVKITHVPYKGSSEALQAILTGDVQVELNTFDLSLLSRVASGKLRALGVTSSSRMDTFPHFPTVAETIPGYEVTSWHGVMAPAQTPGPILGKLEAAGRKALQDQKLRDFLAGRGIQVATGGAAEFGAHIGRELAKWPPIVRSSGAKAD